MINILKSFFNKPKEKYKLTEEQKIKLEELLYQEEIIGEKRVNKLCLVASLIANLGMLLLCLFIGFDNSNTMIDFVGFGAMAIYHTLIFILLRLNIYKRFFKYTTTSMHVLTVTILIIGYAYFSGWIHALRTIALIIFLVAIILSSFYHRILTSIFTSLLCSLVYLVLLIIAVNFGNVKLLKLESFTDLSISITHVVTLIGVFIISGTFLSYLSYRHKVVLERSIYSESEAFKLEKEKAVIKEASQQKTNFFINIAHETKTPLTLISNYLDDYIKKYGMTLELEIIKQNVDKLKIDMTNFLDAEKLEKGMLVYNHDLVINLSKILQSKLILFDDIASKKNILIKSEIEGDIHAKADPYAIDRIINNLVDNAVRYTNPGGSIFVSLKTEKDYIRFKVSDTGIGISNEQISNIFKPYYQISHEKRNLQGIGMGLYIVKNILGSMNAGIEVNSQLDKGSTFIITMNKYTLKPNDIIQDFNNIMNPQNIIDIPIKVNPYSPAKKTLFIVEDNIQMLSFLQRRLDEYNVFYAFNGRDALAELDKSPMPDIIISDIMMDVMDGYQFYDELLNKERYLEVPFIFLTAKTSQDEKITGLLKGAVDFITKPFSIDEIKAKIQSIIKTKDNQKEANIKDMETKISMLLRNTINTNQNIDNDRLKIFCLQNNINNEEDKKIIELLSSGLEYKAISSKLNMQENTLKKRIHNIYLKCDAHNKVELIKKIMKNK